ncbi:hypothetical protein M758_UG182600 [Ceratodon purpureus]|nr:hypothetical protein M758_UG182600 [Ceratodon purpureus]
MILSKARSSISAHGEKGKLHSGAQSKAPSIPDFKQLLEIRDYKGVVTVLQFKRMIYVTRKRLSGWHTRISTMQSMLRRCSCTRSSWRCLKRTLLTTHFWPRACFTWPTTMKHKRLL